MILDQKPTPQDKHETDRVYQSFLKLAGEDREIDWKELKDVLDFSMKQELQPKKTQMKGVNAAPAPVMNGEQQQTQQEDGDCNNLITSVLGLVCGAICKDTPLADIIPPPAQSNPLYATFAELTQGGFSKDICRSMVAMMDGDRSGKLGYQEFKRLWNILGNWKNVWQVYDKDASGTFSGFELREALKSAGYRLNTRILNALMHRYGNKSGEIQFDDFILCAVRLKTMMDLFKNREKGGAHTATFTLEEWIESTLYS